MKKYSITILLGLLAFAGCAETVLDQFGICGIGDGAELTRSGGTAVALRHGGTEELLLTAFG